VSRLPRGIARFSRALVGALLAVLLVGSLAPSASARAPYRPRLHTLAIRVEPPIAGVTFTLDGRPFSTDSSGQASISAPDGGTHRLAVRTPPARHGMRFRFQRWVGDQDLEDFHAAREIVLRGAVTRLVAGFETLSLVGWRFADERGEAIPTGVAQSIKLRDDTGGRYQFAAEGLHWLPTSRMVRQNNGQVTTRFLVYSVESVMVDGTSVVFRSQQRFRPTPGALWTIRLRYYEMLFKVQDAIFRFPIGSALYLRYPDGRVHRLPLDHGTARSGRLARGDYEVRVQGPGLSTRVPVSLSRSQQVRVVFVSWLDIALAVLVLVLIAVGLPLLGGRLRLLRRRRPPPDRPVDPAAAGLKAPASKTSDPGVPERART
jgi:hypothetical protein